MRAPCNDREHRELWGTVVETPDGEGTIVEPDDQSVDWRREASIEFDDGTDYSTKYYPTFNWSDIEPIEEDEEGEDEEDEEVEENQYVSSGSSSSRNGKKDIEPIEEDEEGEDEEDEEVEENQYVSSGSSSSRNGKKGSPIIMALGANLSRAKDKTITSGKAGALLTVGKQAAKRSLAVFLKARKTAIKKPSPVITVAEGFLNTDLGLGCYAVVAGTALVFFPQFSGDQKWSKLAGAMQTWGFHIITDGVLDPILDEIQGELGDLLDKVAGI